MNESNKNKRRRIRHEFKDTSFEFCSEVIDYLDSIGHLSHIQQKINRPISDYYRPFALSSDHEHYRHVVIESLTSIQAQMDLIENVTGINLKRYGTGLTQAMPIHIPHGIAYPTVQTIPQPSLRAMGVVNPTPTPTVSQSDREVVSKFGEELPITEEESETTNSETVLSTFKELEQKLNELLQKIADGEDVLKISRIINNLEPEDEEAWTEDMWSFYDLTRHKVSKIMNPAYDIESQEQS